MKNRPLCDVPGCMNDAGHRLTLMVREPGYLASKNVYKTAIAWICSEHATREMSARFSVTFDARPLYMGHREPVKLDVAT